MKNPFSYLFRARDKPQNAVSAAPSFYFGMSGSGKSVSPNSACPSMCMKPRTKAVGRPSNIRCTA